MSFSGSAAPRIFKCTGPTVVNNFAAAMHSFTQYDVIWDGYFWRNTVFILVLMYLNLSTFRLIPRAFNAQIQALIAQSIPWRKPR
eukprot:scaffold105527_cov48-Attheya_sp.AAC.1